MSITSFVLAFCRYFRYFVHLRLFRLLCQVPQLFQSLSLFNFSTSLSSFSVSDFITVYGYIKGHGYGIFLFFKNGDGMLGVY
jgi:hypothetical protein